MSCDICQQDLSGALMEMPCCQTVFHTQCGIKMISTQLYPAYHAYCFCGSVQYSHSSWVDPPLPDTPAFSAALKGCNKARIVASKAAIKLRKLMREKKREFLDQANVHIQAIKALKKSESKTLRSSDVFKAYNKARNTYYKHFETIANDFNLIYAQRRQLRLQFKDRHLWRLGSRSIHRLFRLGL
jgi:hypothetical protein